jgi:hypothetical protein
VTEPWNLESLVIQDSILVCSPDPRIPHTAEQQQMDEYEDSKKRAGEKPKFPPIRIVKKKLNGKLPRDSKGNLYIVAESDDTMKEK